MGWALHLRAEPQPESRIAVDRRRRGWSALRLTPSCLTDRHRSRKSPMVRILSKTRARAWVNGLRQRSPRRIGGISALLPCDSRCHPVAFGHHDDFQEHRARNESEYLERQGLLVEMGRGVWPILTD